MKPFSLNILGQFVYNAPALLNWISAAQPDAVLVMDSIVTAQAIRQRSPQTTVIYRAYNPNDHQWWSAVTPGAWLASHTPFAANGVALQVLNEPTLDDAARAWLEELVRICPATVTLALPNFGVGNPSEKDIEAGRYDWLLRLVCGTRHILALHEYFVSNPDRGSPEYPWLCGRFEYWLERAAVIGLPKPRIVITEHGRDVGGGVEDGWRGQGWSEQHYGDLLVRARALYQSRGIPVCVFGYGHGAGNRWRSFDVQDAYMLLDRMADYQEQTPVTQPPAVAPVPATIASLYANYVNVRREPNMQQSPVGRLFKGDNILYRPPTVAGEVYHYGSASSNRWWYIDSANGWVAADLITLAQTAPDHPLETLDVPFVSQTSASANRWANDCGVACALMALRWKLKGAGLLDPTLITVNDMAAHTSLAQQDDGLLLSEVQALLRGYGVASDITRPLTSDGLVQHIEAGRVTIPLVNYQYIGGQAIGHYVVIVAYGERGFWVHDPYLKGANTYVTRENMDMALSEVLAFANFPNQGLVAA